ncbi:DnaJ domain-containing protein [Colwellia sp. BRX10-4]|jgi:hypothetical protein|uniref:DnaJ domain-containing protein n=1 Tax=Colwellia sp. BRX10-4 TaxID=2759843 RepID=UPI0015F5D39C|nr:DnaJ domain-containing protein [Colwellia sp. BRX10-4]MBA6397606.1 DnaJ domain-containing protein [Colwellia sp. BRX10-4]
MTELFFGAAAFIFIGYLIGKLFKGLNPFLVILGGFILIGIAPVFLQMEQRDFATAFFIVGFILNFERPVTKVKYWISDLFGSISFKRAKAGYVADIAQQKDQAVAELYRQKQQVEEELRQQKYQAEQDIERQRRAAEDDIRRQAENLKREQEKARSNQQKNKNNNSQNRQENGNGRQSKNSSNTDSGYLNPQYFPDACEILGKGKGCTIKEYKAAYIQLIKLYHPDKIAGLSGSRKAQAENEAKLINAAWDTIKKKLR